MFDLGSVVAHIKADLTDFKQGLSEAKNQADDFGNHASSIGSGIKDMTEKAALFTEVLAAGVAEVAKEVINVASNFEQTQTSFGTLLGSEQKAADLMKEIMQFEQHTPFDITTLTNAAKQLLAFGVAQQDVVPKMKELTDMSQGQSYKLQELVSIYGQVNSIQQLNGREVLRLSSIGIPIYEALADHFNKMGGAAMGGSVAVNAFGETVKKVSKDNADQLQAANTRLAEQNAQLKILEEEHPKAGIATEKHNLQIMRLKDSIAATTTKIGDHTISLKSVGGQSEVTAGQIKKMIEQGQVSAEVFNQVLTEMTSKGGLFFNENIRQMSTFSGILSSTRSQIEYAILNLMGIDIGAANEVRKGGLFDTLRTLAAGVLDTLHNLQPVFKEIGENKMFQNAIIGFVIALGALAVILPIVVIAMNPIALAILGIVLAFSVGFALIRTYGGTWIAWWNGFIKGISDTIAKIVTDVKGWWATFVADIQTLVRDVVQFLSPLVNFFTSIFMAIYNFEMFWWNNLTEPLLELGLAIFLRIFKTIADFLTFIWNFIYKNIISPVLKLIIDIITTDWYVIQAITTDLWNAISGFIIGLWNSISGGISKAGNGIKNFLQDLWNGLVHFFESGFDAMKNALVAPFQWAKDEIEKIGNAIKAAADKINPYHKNSPSLVENVQAGVKDIVDAYKTLNQLTFGSPQFAGIAAGDLNVQNSNPITAMQNTISIDMNGAIIADSQSASSMGEKIGDAIIDKLKLSIRF